MLNIKRLYQKGKEILVFYHLNDLKLVLVKQFLILKPHTFGRKTTKV